METAKKTYPKKKKNPETEGRNQRLKCDAGKPRMELIPHETYTSLAKALTYGANKHGVGNWRKVSVPRFLGAAQRHYVEMLKDMYSIDGDTGLYHAELFLINAAFIAQKVVSGVAEQNDN